MRSQSALGHWQEADGGKRVSEVWFANGHEAHTSTQKSDRQSCQYGFVDGTEHDGVRTVWKTAGARLACGVDNLRNSKAQG